MTTFIGRYYPAAALVPAGRPLPFILHMDDPDDLNLNGFMTAVGYNTILVPDHKLGTKSLNTDSEGYLETQFDTSFGLNGSWTMDFWCQLYNDYSEQTICSIVPQAGGSPLWVDYHITATAKFAVHWGNAELIAQSQSFWIEWNHICISFDGLNLRFFLNGHLQSMDAPVPTFGAKNKITIGKADPVATAALWGLNGLTDEFRFMAGATIADFVP